MTSTKSIEEPEMCAVCGASGIGRHYGAICCSGCKGFFRRSVRFQKPYHCPREQNCVVSKIYRNCCRACRFEKCLRIGLDPNLVQGDWGQTGANPVRQQSTSKGSPRESSKGSSKGNSKIQSNGKFYKSTSCSGQSSRSPSFPLADSLPNLPTPSLSTLASTSTSPDPSSPPDIGHKMPLLQHNQMLNSDQCQIALGYSSRLRQPKVAEGDSLAISQYFVGIERLCEVFVDCPLMESTFAGSGHPREWLPSVNLQVPVELAMKNPGKVSPRFPMSWSPSQRICREMLQRVYCRLMVHYFDWASCLPELADFSEEDRQNLIVKRAMRCIWLLCSFRSASLNCQGIAGTCQMLFPYGSSEQATLDPELKELFSDSVNMAFTGMVQPFRQLGITDGEFALLRVLCLFTPVCHLSEAGQRRVSALQSKYLNVLSDLVHRNCAGQTETEDVGPLLRMSKLLIFLTTAEQVAQLDDNAFSILNVFNLAGMRGTLTYDIHIRAQEERGSITQG